MDMKQMGGVDSAPQEPADGGASPAPVQTNAEAIATACVAATDVAMSRMKAQMRAAGHAPPGV